MPNRITALTLTALLSTAACSSSDSPVDPEDTGGTFTATVDGQPWTGEIQSLSTYYNGFALSLTGIEGDLEIAMIVDSTDPENAMPGTVDLRRGSTGAHVRDGDVFWHVAGEGGSGTLTVSELSMEGARGTFSFVGGPLGDEGIGTRTVTDGSFDISF